MFFFQFFSSAVYYFDLTIKEVYKSFFVYKLTECADKDVVFASLGEEA